MSCDSCGNSFTTKNELRNHIRSGHLENIIITSSKTVLCTSCGKSFVNLQRLSRHLITSHINTEPLDEIQVLCITCDGFFENIYLLEAHLKKAHTEDNSVISLQICTSCDEYFLSKYTLQHHLRTIHEENVPYCLPAGKTKLCTSCGKYFSSQLSLRTHRKIIHSDYVPVPIKNDRTEPCTFCGKYFINKHTLRTHLKVVHNENVHIIPHKNKKTVPCTFCGKSFVSNKTLRRHLRNTHKEMFTVSTESKTVSCTHCQKSFVNKYTLREHLRRVHKIEIPIEAFKEKALICDYCHKSFSSRSKLVQHMKNLHNLSTAISKEEEAKVCSTCGKRFVNNFTLREHLKRIHKDDVSVPTKKKTKLCTSCGKTFATNFTLRGHLKRIHKEEVLSPPPKNKTVPCSICPSAFTKFSTFRRHMENIHHQVLSEHHPVPKKDKTVKPTKERTYRRCALCDKTADGTREMLYHYEDEHNLNMSYQKYAFDNEEDFYHWKDDVENNTRCSFKTNYTNRRRNGTLVVYWCNRTGSFVSRSTGKRQGRTIGSKKINSFCPAHMRVDFTASGVWAKFISEHVGHETNKLCHMNLSKLERDEIVEQLREGVPPRDILRRMKYPLPTSKDDWKRIHLLTVRDIRYIGKRFGVYRPFGREPRVTSLRRRQRNGTCVDLWVDANEDKVLYYKKKYFVDERHELLMYDDFVLIVMSAEQIEALKTWGENVLTVDCARHLHLYGFVLTTVSVVDDCNRAFGACFMFSNRVDEALLRVLFEMVKEEVGVLRVKTFVEDTTDECWNAWRHVFPEPKFRLHCPWHVLREWRDDLNEISLENVSSGARISEDELFAIKKQTYRFLKMNLLREKNEAKFESQLNDFLEQNALLEGFRKQFRNRYSSTKRRWARCFRKYAEMDDDVAADSFYKILKRCLGNRKRIFDVDDALQAVSEYLSKKLEKEVIAEEKGWDDYKVAVLKIRHKKSLSKSIENVSPEGPGWLVESTGGRNGADEAIREIYFIEKVNAGKECVDCKTQCADCNVCVHRFRCTCADSAVLTNMCTHIHLVCRYLAASAVELTHHDERLKPKKEDEALGAQSDDGRIDTVENAVYWDTEDVVVENDTREDVVDDSEPKLANGYEK